MRLGIGSYTYGWHSGTYGGELTKGRTNLTAEELIERAAGFGIQVVQIVLRPALEAMDDAALARIRALAEARRVEIEVGTAGSDPPTLHRWLRAACALNARLMRTIFTQPSPGLVEEEARLRDILPEFRRAGVALAVENHETSGVKDLRRLVDAIGDPHLGVCLDTVNSLGRGEGVWEVAEVLMPVTLNLHVKDFTVTRSATDMGFTVTGAPTGQGKLNVPHLLERMHTHRPDVSAILEQWTPLTGTIEAAIAEQERWAEGGVRYLKEQLKRFGG
jgi:sugar phosphate isomerase/epimerase